MEAAESNVDGMFSCVVDSNPRFHLDSLRWYAALTEVAGVSPTNLVVHLVRGIESDAIGALRRHGVEVQVIEPFDSRSPHCNKIAGALALASRCSTNSVVVLTDADVAVAKDPRSLRIRPGTVGAKIVDTPNPPLDVLARVFSQARLELPRSVEPDLDRSGLTVEANFNGGIYLIPGTLLPALSRSWAKWARWLLDHAALGPHARYLDQVAMAMAVVDEGAGVAHLGREWNFPTHVPQWISSESQTPFIIHYHERVDVTGLISATGNHVVDTVIARLNAAITGVLHDVFPNQTFWDWRYSSNPALGSGTGSRGEPLKGKRRLLKDLVTRLRPASVLDVGCGDGEAVRGLELPHYTGLDVSAEALRLARSARPDGTFHLMPITELQASAELTICLDVLIHEPDAETYRRTVAALLRTATRVLVVSGYERAHSSNSPMVHFHEPLSETITRIDPAVECVSLREIHEITTFAVVKPPFDQNWPGCRHRRIVGFLRRRYRR